MATTYRRAMDLLYLGCVVMAGVAMVLISAVVPYGVFTRYVLNNAASWPEASAILLSIVLTFFGAAACYRLGLHMRVSYLRDIAPAWIARICDLLAETLMFGVGGFMTVHGISLCQTTWNQSIAEFPLLSVGATRGGGEQDAVRHDQVSAVHPAEQQQTPPQPPTTPTPTASRRPRARSARSSRPAPRRSRASSRSRTF